MGDFKRAIARDASVVASALDATDMMAALEQIHKPSAVVTAGLGRLTITASLIGYGLKNEQDCVTLRVDGGGPAGQLVAVADSRGNVKSYVTNPVVELPLNPFGKLDVGGAVGKDGTLTVIKDLGLKEPYVGISPLVSGEIAEDVASYFANSEQVPTVCGLGVLVNPDLSVRAAGGYLIQLLPFASEECIATIERTIAALPPVTQLLTDGLTAEEISLRLLDGLEPNLLDGTEVAYRCDCSRERTERVLISLGAQELTQMAEEGKDTEVCCHFCNKKYTFTPSELRGLLKKSK